MSGVQVSPPLPLRSGPQGKISPVDLVKAGKPSQPCSKAWLESVTADVPTCPAEMLSEVCCSYFASRSGKAARRDFVPDAVVRDKRWDYFPPTRTHSCSGVRGRTDDPGTRQATARLPLEPFPRRSVSASHRKGGRNIMQTLKAGIEFLSGAGKCGSNVVPRGLARAGRVAIGRVPRTAC